MSLLNSSRIYSYSLDVFQDNRKLLVFPLLTGAVWLSLFALMAGPEVWDAMWHPRAHQEATKALLKADHDVEDLPILMLAGAWLTGMFFTTLINVAFYSQALGALNGNGVSISNGFNAAFEKLPAIAGWSLFAGTFGMLLEWIESWFVFGGGILDLVIGVGWTAATQFVIPIMVKEPKPQLPHQYLLISARVLRPVWGDGLSMGMVGPAYAAGLWMLCILAVSAMVAFITHLYALMLWALLLVFCIQILTMAVLGIFRCGLYIFATEGVAPGPFDAETFHRVWQVK